MESTFVTCVCRPLSLTYNPFRAYAGLVEPRIVYSNVKIDKIDWLSQNDILINAIKNSSHVIHHITSNENRCCKAMQISMTTAYPGIDDAILTCRLERAEAEKLARMLEATEEWMT